MKLLLSSLPFICLVSAVRVAYDTIYDNGTIPLTAVSCSDGVNGLLTKGYKTFSALKNFPNIGSAAAVAGWNSTACGSCWKITYPPTGKSINVVAVDHAAEGFALSLTALNTLTNGQGLQFGWVDATVAAATAADCKL